MTNTDYQSPHVNVLIVDDEANIRKTLGVCLESRGHRVTAVGNAKDALAQADRQVYDLAFVDLRLGTESGLDLIPLLIGACPWIKIVVITAYASVDTAVEAMRRGATDYISKPFTPEPIALVTERVAMVRSMEQRIVTLKEDLKRLHPEVTFSSRYPSMQRAIELARQVAPSEAVVLLRGPSGTGKTVLARAFHGWSQRADRPFGTISCPTLSPELLESELFGHVKGAFTGALRDKAGKLKLAEGGTVFLDEVSEIPVAVQGKLLRFIQHREFERVGDPKPHTVDVRIIAATNKDLEERVREGAFRKDLYFRVNVLELFLPPLRERPEDIPLLVEHYLNRSARLNAKAVQGLADEAMQRLQRYTWPGNIRELINIIERSVIMASESMLKPQDLPPHIANFNPAASTGIELKSLVEIEKAHIQEVISHSPSLEEAAKALGIDPATLWRKRKKYQLD